jgi:CRISPR-associated endonuclease/helicase Cas3
VTSLLVPISSSIQRETSLTTWLDQACLLARAAGYLHDWGKSSLDFFLKLEDSVQGRERRVEPVRHEWLSYALLKAARVHGFEAAWVGASTQSLINDCESLKKGLVDRDRVLEYLLVSHHKLLGGRDIALSGAAHIQGHIPVSGVRSAGNIDGGLYADASRLLTRIPEAYGAEHWELIAVFSRAALILADHFISSVDYQALHGQPAASCLFANTKDTSSGQRRYDQPLDWHLRSVGDLAGDIAMEMGRQEYPGLSPATIASIMAPATHPRFDWQDQAVAYLKAVRENNCAPALVFCGAGTGAGKTRGNAKIACALSANPRFCVALNLRSLTLQTGDSLRIDLQIRSDEIAVVIGDRITEQMHRASSDAFSMNGNAGDQTEIEVSCDDFVIPTWLQPLARSQKAPQLLMPPVLVSTIDFIINASEPGRQGHHALALLRVMNSDLILDEIDSYDPQAMVAVLRLIQLSAMLGRNVICSSATLSVPVAVAVHEAFLSGARMRGAVEPGSTRPVVVMIDDLLPPAGFHDGAGEFGAFVAARYAEMIDSLQQKAVYRQPRIAKVAGNSDQAYLEIIRNSVLQLHADHQWELAPGKHLSFGLIRVANISTAIKVARYLSEQFGDTGPKIACYHSNELRIQRHLKEQRLDYLLNRKSGHHERLGSDPELLAAFPTGAGSVPMIVIATPVEEVGRDHDFDWAVIEPSSAQSIVQTSGRVNRHRLVEVDKPNVVILDCNLRSLKGSQRKGLGSQPCFVKPGFEVRACRYSSTKISEMLHVGGAETPLERIDASFRLSGRQIAKDEDRIISKRLEEGMDIILRREGCEAAWMTQAFYERYPLRGSTSTDRYRIAVDQDCGEFVLQKVVNSTDKSSWERRAYRRTAPASNAWLVWPDEYLVEKSIELGIQPDEAMVFELANYQPDQVDRVIHRDESFGFYHEG